MSNLQNIYLALTLCGTVICANNHDLSHISKGHYQAYAAIVKDMVCVAEREYIHALENGGAYENKKMFSTWVRRESSAGFWYKTLYSVHIATNNHLHFADGSIKPGFEIILEEQRSERIAPCNTGVPIQKHDCPRHQLSKELFKLPFDMSTGGQKVIQLDSETECEVLVRKSDLDSIYLTAQEKFIIRRAILVTKKMSINDLQ